MLLAILLLILVILAICYILLAIIKEIIAFTLDLKIRKIKKQTLIQMYENQNKSRAERRQDQFRK